ncbi:hypothetical protein VaNZ11_015559 [Volvox africanus]|uniref:Uncharacterized protein n=1 Tax=Volvox africanus TaxID=51714 RepID=A0ABQ5SM80_9CHLO|nr:hypothetical protein VaNZ11_015559 [Volvox africanus]
MARPRPGSCVGLLQRDVGRRRPQTLASLPGLRHSIHEKIRDNIVIPSLGTDQCEVGIPLISGAFQVAVSSLRTVNGALLNGSQMMLIDKATTSLARIMLGQSASPSMQLAVSRALNIAALIGYPASRISTLMGSISQPDLVPRLTSAGELASLISAVLSPTAMGSLSLSFRAVATASSLAVACINIGAATQGLFYFDHHQVDVLSRAEEALELVSSCAGVLENGQELIGLAAELTQAAKLWVAQARVQCKSSTAGSGDN